VKLDWDPATHYQDVEVAERYDHERFSHVTGRIFNALERYNVARAFEGLPKDKPILDLPCGTGRLAETLLSEGFTVVGVDISEPMLQVARRRLARFGAQFTTKVASAAELARQSQQRYQAALCARVLMHFPLAEQIEFLKAVAKLTTGPVILTQSLNTPYQRFRRHLKRHLGNAAPAAYPINEDQLRHLLHSAGLREERRIRPLPLLTEEIIVVAGRF
jgi:2-polyprenyl-3-methyl-5-hydroxy-6-metoxy-1,4-benzoquinol methylase